MFERVREKMGMAGLVVAVVALVAALGGGAYAASGGLTGKQKNEVKSISKTEAKKLVGVGPPGATGPAGSAGSAGPKGDPGAAGAAGKGVVVGGATVGECAAGGKTVEVEGSGTKNKICNGEEGEAGPKGEPWIPDNALPSKATETGAYLINSESGTGTFFGFALGNISIPIALPAEIDSAHSIYVPAPETSVPAECENTEHAGASSPANPEADPGYFCIYKLVAMNMNGTEMEILKPGGQGNGVYKTGATIAQEPTAAEARGEGTWAVTAP